MNAASATRKPWVPKWRVEWRVPVGGLRTKYFAATPDGEVNAALFARKKARETGVRALRLRPPVNRDRGSRGRKRRLRDAVIAASAGFLLFLAPALSAQTVAQRAKARGDSILAVGKCWRWVRTPRSGAPSLPPCATNAQADTLVRYAPMQSITPKGVTYRIAAGDTMRLRVILLRGFLYVSATKGPPLTVIPAAPADAVRQL